jgi:hypothetical protein
LATRFLESLSTIKTTTPLPPPHPRIKHLVLRRSRFKKCKP